MKNVPVKTTEAASSGGLKLSGDQKSPSVSDVQVDYGTVTAEPPTGKGNCHAMLCIVMLCYAMHCHAMLCYESSR